LSGLPGEDSRVERFKALYEENYHRVLGYAIRRVGADDAGDVVAETFFAAWRRFDEVPTDDAARLWLYGTARRVVANQKRGRRRRERLTDRLRGQVGPPTEPVGSGIDVNAAGVAFGRLSADDRELLSLVAWEGLRAGEIGQVLGCSSNAARIRVHRARRRFARELARIGGPVKQSAAGGHVTEAYE
jgi:RNA polymerase sigma-70 factor, ECF subfamily